MSISKPFYGLDFGTSNSVITIAEGEQVRILPVDIAAPRSEVLQSLLYFKKDGGESLGQAAVESYLTDNANRRPVQWQEIDTGEEKQVEIAGENGIIYYTTTVKVRVDINKPGQLLQALKTTLREGSLHTAYIFNKKYSLENIIAKLLSQMKQQADKVTGMDLKNVVLGRPVHYIEAGQDDVHVEKRMEEAAKIAGFEKVEFMAEPIAAALSYLSGNSNDKTILIFDFGGGTLDFSIVQRDQGGKAKVIATGGLSIGGNTFNEEIMVKLLAPYFGSEERWGRKKLPMPVFLKHSLRRWYELGKLQTREIRDFLNEVERTAENTQAVNNLQDLINYDLGFALFQQIEEAKKQLSKQDQAVVEFNRERLNLKATISRDQFEQILDPYEIQIDQSLDQLLSEANISHHDLDHVIATGGSSQIPKFKQLLVDKFGEDKIQYHGIFTGVGAGLALADRLG